jgi:hypothetical protein
MALVMHDLELRTFLQLNKGQPMADPSALVLPIHRDDNRIVEEAAHPIDYFTDLLYGIISNQRDKELIDKLINIPSLPTLQLTADIEMIYLSWLTHIKKSQYWTQISADQALDVVLALRKWALNLQSIQRIARTPLTTEITRTEDKTHIIAYPDSLPSPEEPLTLLSKYARKEGGK